MWSEVRYSPSSLSRMPSKSGSTLERNSCGGRPPHFGFQIHLWPMAQTLRLACRGSVMPASVAATMSQCSKAVANVGALVRIVAQPVQQLGEAPLVRVDAAAPLDGLEVFGVGERGDLAALRPWRDGRTRGSTRRAAASSRRPGRRWNRWCRGRWPRPDRRSIPASARPCAWPGRARSSGRRATAWRSPGRRGLRFSGYSAEAVLRRPRSLSSSVTRTLRVPKSTPATMATCLLLMMKWSGKRFIKNK